MQKQDLKQISNLLDQKLDQKFKSNDQKLDQKFKDNNEVLLKKIDKKMDEKIDELAIMVKCGFDNVDKRFDQVDKRFDRAKDDISTLEKGHEAIILRLDNACPVR